MTLENSSCDDLESPSYANFCLSMYIPLLFSRYILPERKEANLIPSFILVGILVSYIPQHHRIISRRTSEGLSPYYVLLGTTSSTSAFANILTLPASRESLACCSEVSGFDCFAGLLGIAQVGIQCVCFTLMYVVVSSIQGIRWQLTQLNSAYFSSSSFSPVQPHSNPATPCLHPLHQLTVPLSSSQPSVLYTLFLFFSLVL